MAKFHQTRISGSTADPTPTSYTVNNITLTDNLGNDWDMTNIVTSINMFESIYNSSVEVTLNVGDGVAFLERAVITGNEKIVISIQQSQKDTKRKFDLELYIVEVMSFYRSTSSLNTYQIMCMSKHMYTNSFLRINRAFKNTIGQLIETICKKDLKIEKINDINLSSQNIINGIYPRLRPLAAINWLMRNAVEDGTPFYFYETVFNGINYRSHKQLLEQDSYREYKHSSGQTQRIFSPDSYEELASKINNFSSDLNLSKLSSISEGAFASTIHELDIYNKSYTKTAFGYESIKYKLNGSKPFNESVQFNETTFDKSYESIHYYINKNSGSDNYHTPMSQIGVREAYLENSDVITQNLSIAGDFELTCGAVIELSIPKSQDSEASDIRGNDKLNSGKYLVSGIQHKFGLSGYTMNVTAIKDSFVEDWKIQG